MKFKAINLTKVLKGITSGWVAISSDYKKVVIKGKDYRSVSNQAQVLAPGSVFLMPVAKTFRNVVTTLRR